ncbi:hypothetical protein [Zeimonas arvi]|uniref:hypothetical protein n=1 Tax=Zeimonas arvi TaxID=2498847 RepID=UPI002B3FFEBF|nr:hypothetical protein [Zeimonas arvi]
MTQSPRATRRRFLGGLLASAASPVAAAGQPKAAPESDAARAPARIAMRQIPSTGEAIPAIGLGSWITFNVGRDPLARERCAEVIRAFLEAGAA